MTTQPSNLEFLYNTDLLDLDSKQAQLIAQQCNCTSKTAKGLSKDIIDRYPHADFYTDRGDVPSKPGTIKTLGKGKDRIVLAMFAQLKAGGPSKGDSEEDREKWFKMCLDKLTKNASKIKSVAFPYGIGCGLAKGEWSNYQQLIFDWAEEVKDTTKVYIVSRDAPPESLDEAQEIEEDEDLNLDDDEEEEIIPDDEETPEEDEEEVPTEEGEEEMPQEEAPTEDETPQEDEEEETPVEEDSDEPMIEEDDEKEEEIEDDKDNQNSETIEVPEVVKPSSNNSQSTNDMYSRINVEKMGLNRDQNNIETTINYINWFFDRLSSQTNTNVMLTSLNSEYSTTKNSIFINNVKVSPTVKEEIPEIKDSTTNSDKNTSTTSTNNKPDKKKALETAKKSNLKKIVEIVETKVTTTKTLKKPTVSVIESDVKKKTTGKKEPEPSKKKVNELETNVTSSKKK